MHGGEGTCGSRRAAGKLMRSPHHTDVSTETMPLKRYSIRQLIFGLLLLGMVGLIVDLFLLEHTDSFSQWSPLVLLGAGLVSSVVLAMRPSRGALEVFRAVMVLFVANGLLGVYFHFAGNVEFALERNPSLRGLPLVWKALGGATPAMAPGALAQLGLLGLVYAYRRPAVGRATPEFRDDVE